MNYNGHLTIEGLYQIINIKASMNLKNKLKKEFTQITPRQIICNNNITNPNWQLKFSSLNNWFKFT